MPIISDQQSANPVTKRYLISTPGIQPPLAVIRRHSPYQEEAYN